VIEISLSSKAKRVSLLRAHLRDACLLLLDHFHAHKLFLNAERGLFRI
jgi:hypothetical protein